MDCFFDKKSKNSKMIKKLLSNCKRDTSGHGIDSISKRFALTLLQKNLAEKFGRITSEYDRHGVKDFTIKRNVLQLNDDEEMYFKDFVTTGSVLKKQAKSFKVFYMSNLCKEEQIKLHYVDKKRGRCWNTIFDKHFYVSCSEIDILYDYTGKPVDFNYTSDKITRKKIILVTGVGFDVSAHRLTGVHFGDFIQLCKRKDGLPNFPSTETKINPTHTELWKDSYNYWMNVMMSPTGKYFLDEKTLINNYIIQFSLTFKALQYYNVEVPVIAAIGCGVFGNKFFPEYQRCVIKAYLRVLGENDYSFKAVVLCELNGKNLQVFKEELKKSKIKSKVPFYIMQYDIMDVARNLSLEFSTSVHNAGDLWEFGQFFEGGGALEEYCARMTTGYFSQHFLMNPEVVNNKNYIKVNPNELGIKIDEKHYQELIKFIKIIKDNFEDIKDGELKGGSGCVVM